MEITTFLPLEAGPEVEFFANKLDECLDFQHSKSLVFEKRDKILQLVDTYYSYALQRSSLRSANSKLLRSSDSMNVDNIVIKQEDECPNDCNKWEAEAQTWDLLRRLLPLRYPDSATNKHAKSTPKSFRHSTATKQSAWDEFLASDPIATERRAVLQWLQSNAATGPNITDLVQDLQQRADRGDIVAHGWIHTRTAIKHHKTMLNRTGPLDPNEGSVTQALRTSNGSTLVTQLDPDCLTRQGRKLQPQDEFFERAIWRGCFELLRRGSSGDVIREWCSERTEAWRAVTMSALPLPGIDSDKPTQGPASIALWRRMCYATARNGGIDNYERAVYGILAGDISSVEKVCTSWDDLLFAHYNALLRTQFDNFALNACGPEAAASLAQSFASFDAIQYHGDVATLEKRLVKSMASNPLIGDQGKNPFKALQGAVLARDLETHFVEQGLSLATSALGTSESEVLSTQGLNTLQVDTTRLFDADQLQGLRIVAHIYIISNLLESLMGSATSQSISNDSSRKYVQGNITVAYLSLISRAGLIELMPMYCSTLVGPRQYEVMSRNLLQIIDREARIQELEIIRRSGLDVLKFVKVQPALQLEALLKSELPNEETFSILPSEDLKLPTELDFMGSPDQIPGRHEFLIRSIEWLLLVDEAWPEVLSMASRVFKYFLKNLRLASARELLVRVPFDRFFRNRADKLDIDEDYVYDADDSDFWASQLNELPAFSGSAKQVTIDARNFRDLASLVKVLDNMETISSLAHLATENEGYREPWGEVVKVMDECRECLAPIMHNWLLASIKDGDKELEKIRSMYLAETILGWISTLKFVGTNKGKDYFMECMDLAALIADGNSDIAQAFIETGRMTELVEAFTACSKEIAVATVDKKSSIGNKRMREAGWSRDLWSVQS